MEEEDRGGPYAGCDDLLAGLARGQISQVDAWAVVRAYFDEKGLVRQQLDSFNECVEHHVLCADGLPGFFLPSFRGGS